MAWVLLGIVWALALLAGWAAYWTGYHRGQEVAFRRVERDLRDNAPWRLIFLSPQMREGMREALRLADERDALIEGMVESPSAEKGRLRARQDYYRALDDALEPIRQRARRRAR